MLATQMALHLTPTIYLVDGDPFGLSTLSGPPPGAGPGNTTPDRQSLLDHLFVGLFGFSPHVFP